MSDTLQLIENHVGGFVPASVLREYGEQLRAEQSSRIVDNEDRKRLISDLLRKIDEKLYEQ